MKAASFEAVVRALNDAGVPFLVVGGIAVNAHGYARFTQDVDLVVKLTPDHVRNAFAALATLGYQPAVPITANQFADPAQRRRWIAEKNMQVLSFQSEQHRETPVDLFVDEPFAFDEEHRLALVEEAAAGVPVRIVRLAALVGMKRRAARPVDRADLAELRAMYGDLAEELADD